MTLLAPITKIIDGMKADTPNSVLLNYQVKDGAVTVAVTSANSTTPPEHRLVIKAENGNVVVSDIRKPSEVVNLGPISSSPNGATGLFLRDYIAAHSQIFGTPSMAARSAPTGFAEFLHDMRVQAPPMDYVWNQEKELSCDWIISRIDSGRGVDIGGTPYLYEKLKAKGCDMHIYDQYLEAGTEIGIRDDMINVLDHFSPGSLDFITTRHTLEHAIDPWFQLWAYNRILKMGGRLFVIVPMHCKEWVWFGTHNSCLPHENWTMMFHRMGFKIAANDAGTWNKARSYYIEWRFELVKDSESLRLG